MGEERRWNVPFFPGTLAKTAPALASAPACWKKELLLCTRAYPHLDRNLAMKIGGEEDPTLLSRRHWEQLAEETELKSSFVLDTVRELAEGLPGAVARARLRFREAYRESPALELVIPKITRQVRRLLRQLDS